MCLLVSAISESSSPTGYTTGAGGDFLHPFGHFSPQYPDEEQNLDTPIGYGSPHHPGESQNGVQCPFLSTFPSFSTYANLNSMSS